MDGRVSRFETKTVGTGWDVVVEPFDPSTSPPHAFLPGVLSLQLDTSQFPEGVEHGFQDEVGHSVVYLGVLENRRITVFDPSPDFGIEAWDDRVLNCVETGVLLRLVPQDPNSPATLGVSRRLISELRNGRLVAQM